MVHKLLFSMPPGTPPLKVLGAVKNFAREEFALQRRYAMVLHTDEPHPHVHMVVKAVSEKGERLNIGKATLRKWRWEFARHLRNCGIAANATERAVRGETRSPRFDGIYRAAQRGDSTRVMMQIQSVTAELSVSNPPVDAGKARLLLTRGAVERGWHSVSAILEVQGQPELAAQALRFVDQMPSPQTGRELLKARILSRMPTESKDEFAPGR